MIKSMTGFASLERQYDFGRLTWELRSVNHRYLEMSLRLPEDFRVLEPEVRQVIARHACRGKVDATLRLAEEDAAQGPELKLNERRARQLLELHRQVESMADHASPPLPMDVLRWPGVVGETSPDREPMQRAAMDLLEEAAGSLASARRREGEKIDAAIRERLAGVARWVADVRQWMPEIRQALQRKTLDRVADLEQPLEPGRLEQEVALLAQKMDVDEELDRLEAHVTEARRTLDLEEPVGRRLDFLMQEFNRESNTWSSKSVDSRTSQAAVELKVLIEQMREQVQNVE